MELSRAIQPLAALTDATRVRLLALLADEELSVAELQAVLGAPQSRISMHLARLREAGLVRDRAHGVHRYYRLAGDAMPEAARAAWQGLKDAVARDPAARADRKRRSALRERQGPAWVDRVAGSLERHYSPGRTWEALARGFATGFSWGDVADIGAGEGVIAELLAPQARRVTCVDLSDRMIEAGRARLLRAKLGNVTFVRGDMEKLPLPDASFDFALLNQSLQYARDPARALVEAARILRPGGRLLAITLAAHEQAEVRDEYGHVQLGFAAADLRRFAARAGFAGVRISSAGREKKPPQFEALALAASKPGTQGAPAKAGRRS